MEDQKQMFRKITQLFRNANSQILVFASAKAFSVTTDNKRLIALKADARKRGVKLRYITEITKENLQYCKRQMSMVDELRHIDGAQGNFVLSDSEFVISSEVSPRHPIDQGLYGSVDKILEQYKRLFEIMWNHSIPAEEMIKEIEGETSNEPAIQTHKQDRVIDGFYVCKQCNKIFVHPENTHDHETQTGHNIKYYQLK